MQKKSCSVKLQGGPLDHNPRKILAEDSWIIISQNNSKCLLLNDKQMPHDKLFSWRNTKKEEIWKKSKKYRVSCFNTYIVVIALPSITAKKKVDGTS